ncbi:TauD/TfdA family dioxygenase [Streptomyces sp. NPDC097107]|uniref:TauD/TfdA family dioxygenase n=1 Tax=Streptomyces sp. NPDC097107 TaxID=3366089 RepID=UPI0038229787
MASAPSTPQDLRPGAALSHSPLSILSQVDFNGNPLSDELLAKTFHQLMDEHGYVLMCNVLDSFDQVRFCRELGTFVPNYTGAVVGDVRPEPGMDDVYHAGNTRPLTPHTEGYDFAVLPPRYIALWCVTPASGAGGETTLCDTRPWVQALPDEERKRLLDHTHDWKTTEGVQRLGLDLKTRHPILEEHEKGLIVRFSCNNLLREDDDPAADLQERWKRAFEAEHIAVTYQRNDMLVWDNWRLLHARNAFTDRSRHLRRIQVAA